MVCNGTLFNEGALLYLWTFPHFHPMVWYLIVKRGSHGRLFIL